MGIYGTTILAFTQKQFSPSNALLEQFSFLAAIALRRRIAEKALLVSESRLRQITNNISDLVFTADLELNLTYLSLSVERFIGESTEKHLNRRLEEKFPKATLQKIYSVLREESDRDKEPQIDRNRTRIVDVEQYRADGGIMNVSMHLSFIRNDKGNPIGIQGISRDVTEQKKQEIEFKNHLRFENALSQCSNALLHDVSDAVAKALF